jgi:chaperonin GroES
LIKVWEKVIVLISTQELAMASKKDAVSNVKCPLQPTEDHILVRRLKIDKTSGGILVPGKDDPKVRQLVKGVVVAVGPGRTLDTGFIVDPVVSEGDIVFFSVQSQIDMGEEVRQFFEEKNFSYDNLCLIGHGNVVLRAE